MSCDRANMVEKLEGSIRQARGPGERIHKFVTRLSSLAEHREYREEKDNMIRDQVLMHIEDKNLKAELFHTDNLTVAKRLEVVPDVQINRVHADEKQFNSSSKFNGKCSSVVKLSSWPWTVAV